MQNGNTFVQNDDNRYILSVSHGLLSLVNKAKYRNGKYSQEECEKCLFLPIFDRSIHDPNRWKIEDKELS